MCRYAGRPYKEHYACFDCRKAFKRASQEDVAEREGAVDGECRPVPCPECGKPMAAMGLDFKAPRQSDIKQWRKVEILFRHGIAFRSCGCAGPGFRPRTLRDVKPFLAATIKKSPGEQLLLRFNTRNGRHVSRLTSDRFPMYQ
jgi:hypothetical protein